MDDGLGGHERVDFALSEHGLGDGLAAKAYAGADAVGAPGDNVVGAGESRDNVGATMDDDHGAGHKALVIVIEWSDAIADAGQCRCIGYAERHHSAPLMDIDGLAKK
jgi:hypothetical protein